MFKQSFEEAVSVSENLPTVGGRAAKDELFEALTTSAKALSNGRRAEIIELLAQGPRSVDEIANAIDQSVANTSHHLQALARSGLVTTRRQGTRVIYGLAGPEVFDLWQAIRAVAASRRAEVSRLAETYLGDRTGLETVSREELARRLGAGEVVVVDVRPEEEHRAGHIPGAISIPIDDLDRRLAELPESVDIVTYCRGPYCAYADEAVRRLRRHGRRAWRLEDGYPEWQRSQEAMASHPAAAVDAAG